VIYTKLAIKLYYFKFIRGEDYEKLLCNNKYRLFCDLNTHITVDNLNPYNISSSTIRRLKAGQSVSTNPLDALCNVLDCAISDIIEFIPDKINDNNVD